MINNKNQRYVSKKFMVVWIFIIIITGIINTTGCMDRTHEVRLEQISNKDLEGTPEKYYQYIIAFKIDGYDSHTIKSLIIKYVLGGQEYSVKMEKSKEIRYGYLRGYTLYKHYTGRGIWYHGYRISETITYSDADNDGKISSGDGLIFLLKYASKGITKIIIKSSDGTVITTWKGKAVPKY